MASASGVIGWRVGRAERRHAIRRNDAARARRQRNPPGATRGAGRSTDAESALMAGTNQAAPAERLSLPAFDRLAPPPPRDVLEARIEAHTTVGEAVLDPFGRGGWAARAALDRGRQAVSFETAPLTRLLAEVVLRPPDLRHLDAAFQVIATAPHGQTTLRAALNDLFATSCATCGRTVVLDELVWQAPKGPRAGSARATRSARAPRAPSAPAAPPTPIRKHYRCAICRDQLGGGEQRTAPADEADRTRAAEVDPQSREWRQLHDRFPVQLEHTALVDDLLDLHTPRQLVALHAILERIDAELRAPAVEAALRLAFLEALLASTRLAASAGKPLGLRIAGGRVQPATTSQWRERNAWLAFEDGLRLVRGFVQRLDSGPTGLVQARFRDDLRGLGEQPNSVLVRVASAAVIEIIAAEAAKHGNQAGPRIRLVAGQLPPLATAERLALGYLATGWVLGANAAATLPVAALLGERAPDPDDHARRIEAQLRAVTGLIARESRAILLLDEGGATHLAAAAIGAVGAGYRVIAARLDPGPDGTGMLELVPPGGNVPGGPRTRANQALPPLPGGAGDPNYVPGRGLFAPPERLDAHRFSAADAQAATTALAIDALQARGEPATEDRLIGELLVGLDRAGHLRRFVRDRDGPGALAPTVAELQSIVRAGLDQAADPGDPATASHRRLEQVEPGSWWLADREDRAHAALPLADRVEWAVFSLLSTGGPHHPRRPRRAHHRDVPGSRPARRGADPRLPRQLSRSSGARGSTRHERGPHAAQARSRPSLLALLTETGHRLGLRVWLGPREQARRPSRDGASPTCSTSESSRATSPASREPLTPTSRTSPASGTSAIA